MEYEINSLKSNLIQPGLIYMILKEDNSCEKFAWSMESPFSLTQHENIYDK